MHSARHLCQRVHLCSALAVLLGACVLSPRALAVHQAQPNRRADREIIAGMEAQWRAALMHGDAAQIDTLLADDFLSISSNGTLADKQEYLRGVRTHEHTFSRIDVSEQKIRMQPASAIVTSRAEIDGRVDNVPLRGVFRYTLVYARQGGAWKVMSFEATRVSGNGAATPGLHNGVPVRR